jgi:hypothetical protein
VERCDEAIAVFEVQIDDVFETADRAAPPIAISLSGSRPIR